MSDSLSLLAYQGGLVSTPSTEQAAQAANDLCVEQRLMRVGDPLPIVFCRREGNVGGCLVSPGATEARFSNDAANVLTASWHLVLGEGPMDPIQVRDVFQCACRVGTSTSAFGRRAGSWSPGNVTVDRGANYTRWELPRFCGAAGTFDRLTTLSFVNTYQDGEDWNRQIHVFSRGGRHVTRLLDGVTGPSSNVADLYLYLLRAVERVPESMIDMESLKHAARFTNLLGMRWDGVLGGKQTENLDDWCENVLKPYFLLARTRRYGMEGLMPLLPTNNDGSLFLGRVGPHATLTEAELDLETWNLQFLSLADRRPICAQMQWRQQGDGVDSIVRTSEIRFKPPFSAPDGPFEQHDLSWFATNEMHAVKIGAYVVAHRAMVTHTLEVSARPGTHNTTVGDGSIVRVRVPRAVDGDDLAVHDYLYRVNSVGKDLMGETKYQLIHMPIDAQGRSAVAQTVYNAQPSGVLLPITKTGPVCDVNSASNTDPLGQDLVDFPPFDDPLGPLDPGPLPDPLDPPVPEPLPPLPPDGPLPGPEPLPPDGPPEPPTPPEPPAGVPPLPGEPDLPSPDLPPLPGGQAPTDPTAPPEPGYPPEGPEGPGGPQWGPPGAPKVGVFYDIYFEQMMDAYISYPGSDRPGDVSRGEWNRHEMKKVSSWWHVQEAWTKWDSANPVAEAKGQMGITAISPNGFGFSYLSASVLAFNSTGQGYTGDARHQGGPTMVVWFHQIRNFRIRVHGSGEEYQPAPPPKPHKY